MRSRGSARGLFAAGLLAAFGSLHACGAKSGLAVGAGPADAGFDGLGGAAGAAGMAGGAGFVEIDGCRRFDADATLAPLDVFLLLDSSGSMEAELRRGVTKWDAVREALDAFFQDPDSAGVGVALTFFPVLVDDVPELCRNDMECGEPDACRILGVCLTPEGIFPSSSPDLCASDDDCLDPEFPVCEAIGRCEHDETIQCIVSQPFPTCRLSTCVDTGFCQNRGSCAPSSYADPAVDLRALPASRRALLSALDTRTLEGPTPTLAGVQGAIDRAQSWALANPSHKVIVVLATDGLPTTCGVADFRPGTIPLAVEEVAQAAGEAVPDGIQTFVIGVFSNDDVSDPEIHLNRIAEAGGSESAFVVSSSDVTNQFLEALVEVRVRAKACEFSIPDIGAEIDYDQLTVTVTTPNGVPVRIRRVGGPGECDSLQGGFFFDREPGPDRTPGRVILCPASCNAFGDIRERSVEVAVDCGAPAP